MLLGGDAGLLAALHHVGAQGRGDTGEVEPVRPLEDGVPVELRGVRLLDGGVGAVVDAHGAALGRALFQVVDAHALAAPDHLAGVHAEVPQGIHCRLADGVGGQLRHEGGLHAVVGKRHCHVGLAAAEGGLHLVVLEEAVVPVGSQAQHQLAECYDLSHCGPPLRSGRTAGTGR